MPRKAASEKPARTQEREALEMQRKNQSYQLLSESDDDDDIPIPAPKVTFMSDTIILI